MVNSAIVIGTGGHSKAVISIIKTINFYNLKAILSLESASLENPILDIPVEGSVALIEKFIDKDCTNHFFLAIGNNQKRKEIYNLIKSMGGLMPDLQSPYAFVDESVTSLGANIICPFSFVGPQVKLGKNNLLNTGCIIEHECTLGSHLHCAPSSVLAGKVKIEDECFLGAGSTVIENITVSHNTIIGAGATVTKDILDNGNTYIGCPARKINSQ